MSNSTQNSDIDVFVTQAILTGNEIDVAASAFYFYDYLLTLFQEFDHIWAKKWTSSTWIFAANRYIVLAIAILRRVPVTNHNSCIGGIRFGEALSTLQLFVSAFFTALRTCALCGRNVSMFLLVFGLSIVPFITETILHIKSQEIFVPEPNSAWDVCDEILPFSASTMIKLTLISRIAVVTGEFIAVVVSWKKAIGTVRQAIRYDLRLSLSTALVQNGTVLFLGLLALNIYQILTYTIPGLFALSSGDPF